MKITSVALPDELTDRIDQVARDSERSRSFVVRKLLEASLTGKDRASALQAIADQGLEDFAAEHSRDHGPNATAVIAESCADGRARLDGLQKIAGGSKA
jgi:predicted transcriptional regulator